MALDRRLEASGVLAKYGLFYVIFYNLPHIASIGQDLSPTAGANHVIRQDKGHRSGFEDIAYDSRNGRYYVLIESLRRGHGKHGDGAGVRRQPRLCRQCLARLPA